MDATVESSAVEGACVEHPDRKGVPCVRCGTFRCAECLSQSLCAPCRENFGLQPPQADDAVGFGRRAGARLLDMLAAQVGGLFGGIAAAVLLALLEAAGAAEPGWQNRFEHGRFFDFGVGSLASLLGMSLGATISGASPGKALLKLRIVRAQGGPAGFKAQLIRELAYFVDALFFGLIAKSAMDSSPLQQRHGDRWAETVVVRSDSPAGRSVASTPRLIAGVFICIAVHAVVIAVSMVLAAR